MAEHAGKSDGLATKLSVPGSDASDIERGGNTERTPLKQKIKRVLWDSLDKTPEERLFVHKIDCWVMSYICLAYFVKYLDQNNVCYISYYSSQKRHLS